MSAFDWLPKYLAMLEQEHVVLRTDEDAAMAALPPARRLLLDEEDWGTAARVAAVCGCRHAGIWGDPVDDDIVVRACLHYAGDYLILETRLGPQPAPLPAHTPYYPGVNRLERHLRDMLGVSYLDHPDDRRWTRHQAWPADQFPLRPEFTATPAGGRHTPADTDYPFVGVLGSGVYELPVGPVHAGIIEPGHFRFHAIGEEVLSLEERLGYVHKGIEKIAVGRDAAALARLAGRVSGDSTVAHAWAACMALERACGITVPPLALVIRALLAERERIANHLGDIGAICNDVAFTFAYMQFGRLREEWLRLNKILFGHRLLMDCVVPGGVAPPLPESAQALLRAQHGSLAQSLEPLVAVLDDRPSLEDRLAEAGVLAPASARQLGTLGYVGKASGMDVDARRDHRYPPYDRLQVASPSLQDGDVAARLQIRIEEIRGSLRLCAELLNDVPPGATRAPWPQTPAAGEGLGVVEGWRGEILSHVRLGSDGRVQRYFPRDPSWFSWPALEQLIHGNIVADFPVCNKSVNASYSGHDL